MDPIGFGLENYDGIGSYRTMDNGSPVDSSGSMAGKDFDGGLQLESILKTDARFPKAVVQYLAGYALGRELGVNDRCLIDSMSQAFQSEDKGRLSALVARVARTDEMRQRRGAP